MRRSHADGVMPEEAVAAGVFLFLRAPVGVGLSFRSLVERLGLRVRFGDLLGVSTLAARAAQPAGGALGIAPGLRQACRFWDG